MSLPLTAAVALAVLLTFWIIGAYNRLVAMRNAVAAAWARLQETLDQRGAAVEPLVSALREPMSSEQGALDTWLAAHAAATRAASAMSTLPLSPAHAQAWVAAEGLLGAAASRVLALLDQQAELSAEPAVARLRTSWLDGQERLPFARQFFNDSAQAHNEAAAAFPTQLVAAGFGLGPVGQV